MLSTQSDTALTFTPKKTAAVTIPYAAITELEYGQKAGRRVAVAVLVSPLALFSKKRKHYLTVTYKDDSGKEQAGVWDGSRPSCRATIRRVRGRWQAHPL